MSSTGIFAAAEVLLQRVLVGRRIAEPELELRRRLQPAVGEIAAAARAMTRRKRGLEEFRGEFDNVVQRLAPLFAFLGLARHRRDRHARLAGEPLDRFGEAHALGLHHEVEDVAVLAGREVEPHRLLIIDEKRRCLLLIERREALPLAPRLAQLDAAADDFRDRKPRPQLVEKLRRRIAW